MMFVEGGGQHLVGFAPAGKVGGPQVFSSGAKGAARAKGLLLVRVAAPQSPPRPMRTSLLFPRMLMLCAGCSSSSWFVLRLFWPPLHATLATWWRFGLVGLGGWHGFREGGNQEGFVETLMVDKKDRGEIEAMAIAYASRFVG